MLRYWWVNHKQTFTQELGGGYLWSPKRERDGRRSQFYDNLREARPGDFVISYANRNISGIGRVTDFATSSPIPDEFGAKSNLWNDDGWLLPVAWSTNFQRKNVEDFIGKLLPLLPLRYSPFDRNGRGAQKAYLSEISAEAFEAAVNLSNSNDALTRFDLDPPPISALISAVEDGVQSRIANDGGLSATEKSQLVLARKGQGVFRRNLLRFENACRLTSINNQRFLVASHIKPWRLCSTSHERLDGCNGLLLTPTADLLFDRGFLTFSDDGQPIFSKAVSSADIAKLNFSSVTAPKGKVFLNDQLTYLNYHRQNIFMS
ncbi:HNH endonuclease [Asticcacaulis taihuensis]|uniref:HNH endonuclease n=1 Tax=Asticcacaulis taihuensis TaxID=260084 RepID=A0A1G4SQ15_9CAUL|nr:HNH endonuclease [Asticcacaulis taihuensis]SCW71270.1 HNH endonuclease [Asticcacaulis taihuensis]